MVTEAFKQQVREIVSEGMLGDQELDELSIAIDEERPSDRAESIGFASVTVGRPNLRRELADRYESIDGNLYLPHEAEAKAYEDDIARNYE